MGFDPAMKTYHSDDPEVEAIITDALSSDTKTLEKEAGPIGRAFITAVDKAVHVQSSPIRSYVHWLRRHNPEATPRQIQDIMDKHFRGAVTGTGAGAGAAAAIPGVGLLTGAAAVAGESLVFLDIAAFYTVASAYLRGVDISDAERRRAIVLVALTGAKGLAVVDTLLGEDSTKIPSAATLSRFSGPGLAQANSIMTRAALTQVRRRLSRAWIGKLLPLGLGAIAGMTANRKLAATIIDNVAPSLGAIPATFATPLPERDQDERNEDAKDAANNGSLSDSLNPRVLIDFVNKAFGRSEDPSEGSEPAPRKGLFSRKNR